MRMLFYLATAFQLYPVAVLGKVDLENVVCYNPDKAEFGNKNVPNNPWNDVEFGIFGTIQQADDRYAVIDESNPAPVVGIIKATGATALGFVPVNKD